MAERRFGYLISLCRLQKTTARTASNVRFLERRNNRRRKQLNGLFVAGLASRLENFQRKIHDMVVYKFYLRDAIKGDIFLGVLPERRRKPRRITHESIINWGRKYFGKNGKDEGIFFIKTVLEQSEKRPANPPPP